MSTATISYVNLFKNGAAPRASAHASATDAAAEVAAGGLGGHLGTLRVEADAHGIARCVPVDPAGRPGLPAAKPPHARMLDRIAEFRHRTAALDALDPSERPFDCEAAAEARCRALDALLDEHPAGVDDYHAKFTALLGFIPEDLELVSLGVLADDARDLAEGWKRGVAEAAD
jgi:hypothetical protein